MPIRILEIVPALDLSGVAKQVAILAAGLPREQFETHVCALRGGPLVDELRAKEISVTVIGQSFPVDPAAYWRLKRHIAKFRPDVVHTWTFPANAYGRQAAFSAGVRHVLASERRIPRRTPWHERVIDWRLARRTERLVTNSAAIADFRTSQGWPAEKLVVIPSGVAPLSSEPPCSREELLRELELPADALLIGAIGQLTPRKRIKDLIWGADLLKCVRDDVHLLIIGDGPHRWRLARFRDQVEIGDRVHFLGWRADVSRLLPHLACLWHGSEHEGQSSAILEAMVAGLPIVATDIAGHRELVTPGETGCLVPAGGRGELARQTKVLLEDPALAKRYGAAGRDRALRDFSAESLVQRHADLYAGLVR